MVMNECSACPRCGGRLKYYDSVPRLVRTKGRQTSRVPMRRLRCSGWLPIGKATRNGNLVASIEEMDSRYGRINFYISPKRLYEETGYFWRGERR